MDWHVERVYRARNQTLVRALQVLAFVVGIALIGGLLALGISDFTLWSPAPSRKSDSSELAPEPAAATLEEPARLPADDPAPSSRDRGNTDTDFDKILDRVSQRMNETEPVKDSPDPPAGETATP